MNNKRKFEDCLTIVPKNEGTLCAWFEGTLNTTSATKCKNCGRELHEH